jgi:hypothetical protein
MKSISSCAAMKTSILVIGILAAGSALACECDSSVYDDDSRFNAAKSVFLVRITEARVVPGNPEVIRATFETLKVLKGNPGGIKELRAETGSREKCASPVVVGGRYLVFTHSNGEARLGVCSSLYFDVDTGQEKEAKWLRRKPTNN